MTFTRYYLYIDEAGFMLATASSSITAMSKGRHATGIKDSGGEEIQGRETIGKPGETQEII